MKTLMIASCAAGILGTCAAANATVTVYTSRVLWEAALLSQGGENLNSRTSDQALGGSSTSVNATSFALTSQYANNGIDSPSNGYNIGVNFDGTTQFSFGGSNSPGPQTLTVSGMGTVNAVGIDFTGGGRLGRLSTSTGSANFDPLTPAGSFNTNVGGGGTTLNSFIGLIDDTNDFTSFQVVYWPNFAEAAVDNFSWGSAPRVPAPASLALAGAGGVLIARRRR